MLQLRGPAAWALRDGWEAELTAKLLDALSGGLAACYVTLPVTVTGPTYHHSRTAPAALAAALEPTLTQGKLSGPLLLHDELNTPID